MIIHQGQHDPNQDVSAFTEKDVLALVIKLEEGEKYPFTLRVTFKLIDGAHTGKEVKDFISYDPSSQFAWKYRSLRKAAGVPYTVGESEDIDIEQLLLNHIVQIDFTENKKTDGRVYQNFSYKAPTKALPDLSKGASFDAFSTPAVTPSPTAAPVVPQSGTPVSPIVNAQGGQATWDGNSDPKPSPDDDLPF